MAREWISGAIPVLTEANVLLVLALAEDADAATKLSHVRNAVRSVFTSGSREVHEYWRALGTAFPEFSGLSVEEICVQLLCLCLLARQAASTVPCELTEFLEFFAGDGRLSSGMEEAGLRVKTFDIRYRKPEREMQDLLTAKGLRYALLSILFTTKDMDVWAGIVCSSWVWISRSTTKRSKDPEKIWGCEHSASVTQGNGLAIRVVGMCLLTSIIGGHWCVEQPISSLLWSFPPFARLLSFAGAKKTVTYLGAFGAASPKAVTLMHTSDWVRLLRRPKPQGAFSDCLVRRDAKGVTGIGTALKASQSYPPEFGRAAAAAKVRPAQWR